MSNFIFDIKTLNLKAVDIQGAVKYEIDPLLSEDVYRYNLNKNNKLLRQFIVFRLISFVFDTLNKCRESKCKCVFLLSKNKNPLSILFSKNDMFIYNTFRRIETILNLNLLIIDSVELFLEHLNSQKGEGKELRLKLTKNTFRPLTPNLQKLNALLEKYKIHKLQGDISQNFKVKLGLYIT